MKHMLNHPPDPKSKRVGAQSESGQDSTRENCFGTKREHSVMLSQQHAHRLPGGKVLSTRRQNTVAVGARIGGKVS